jgi:hypothetical protein
MGIIIQSPQLKMELKIVPLDELFIHEDTIPEALEQLKQELMAFQILKHPLLVDSKTFVVLDGMHRVNALRDLGFNLAPICLVDYQNPAIELYSWYREFEKDNSDSIRIHNILGTSSFIRSTVTLSEAIEQVESRKAFAALAIENRVHSLKFQTAIDIKQIYDEIAKIEFHARKNGHRISYNTESDALERYESLKQPILIVPPLKKQEVVEYALDGKLFTQKTTRHVVPARPLFTNIPLEWLRSSNSESVTEMMETLLKKKRIVRKGPGALIEGRRYEESAYIFEDQ